MKQVSNQRTGGEGRRRVGEGEASGRGVGAREVEGIRLVSTFTLSVG